jgi:hypothetical protein
LGHTIRGELSEGVSGSYNHRKAVAGAPRQPSHEKLQEIPVKHGSSEQVPSNGFATSPDTLVEILSRLMERLDRLEAINSKGRALN